MKPSNAAVFATVLGIALASSHAELSAPDNILYGTIALDGIAVLPSNTNVVVEARRTANGPAVATYRMGDNPDAVNFYALKIPLEEQAPLDTPATSSLITNSLFIVVREATTDRGQQTYVIPERGHVTRLDFDIDPLTGPPDTDTDGLPDPWEQLHFSGLGQTGGADFDGDGNENLCEYLAGTDPKSGTGYFQLLITKPAAQKIVSFFAVSTAGVTGYEGTTRHYAIEAARNLGTGPWNPVPGYTDIIGNNTTVAYPTQQPDPAFYYRGKVWLTRP